MSHAAARAAERPALEVGTPERRVRQVVTALIRLVYVPGMDKQSCPAIVACGGRMDFHGARLGDTWTRLGANRRGWDIFRRPGSCHRRLEHR